MTNPGHSRSPRDPDHSSLRRAFSTRPAIGPRQSSWPNRLKPVNLDPLDAIGYPSKGEKRLFDPKTQETYYNDIVRRFSTFCAEHKDHLNEAFASIWTPNPSDGWAQNPPMAVTPQRPMSVSSAPVMGSVELKRTTGTATASFVSSSASSELCKLLFALRKLREGLNATPPDPSNASATVSHQMQVNMYLFSLHLGLLTSHPPTYVPSLHHLLLILHRPKTQISTHARSSALEKSLTSSDPTTGTTTTNTATNTTSLPLRPSHPSDSNTPSPQPLPSHILTECLTYLILDAASRQQNLNLAYSLRSHARHNFSYRSRHVDALLDALTHDNWLRFWRAKADVDGYVRGVVRWAEAGIRRKALKAVGRSYLSVGVEWVEGCAGWMGGERGERQSADSSSEADASTNPQRKKTDLWDWDRLVLEEGIGWARNGDVVTIRAIKAKVPVQAPSTLVSM